MFARLHVSPKPKNVGLMDQPHLIERSLNGDLNAFNELVIEYQNLAYSVAYRLLDDTDAAGDAVQDSFIKAFRALDTFRGGSFKSWLMRIVTNTCYDVLRARQRRKTDSLEAFPVEDEYIPALVDKSESPQQYVERQELAKIIALAIQHLPEDQQVSIILCDIEGYTYEEIAEISGVAIGTVKSRISRARGKVRDYLIQHPELLPLTFRPNAE
jgi:RNA polymerase sigma-70 factor, ECF subfamily